MVPFLNFSSSYSLFQIVKCCRMLLLVSRMNSRSKSIAVILLIYSVLTIVYLNTNDKYLMFNKVNSYSIDRAFFIVKL